MDACHVMVGIAYVVAACTVLYAIQVRCRATIEDIERYSWKTHWLQWYAVRVATIVVLIGGLMHARHFSTVFITSRL